jgi:hypothetical protein
MTAWLRELQEAFIPWAPNSSVASTTSGHDMNQTKQVNYNSPLSEGARRGMIQFGYYAVSCNTEDTGIKVTLQA